MEKEKLEERLDELEDALRLTAKQKYELIKFTVYVIGFVAVIYLMNN